MARKQYEVGADYIDMNCGTFINKEPEILGWLVQGIQQEIDVTLCIDSPSHETLIAALNVHKEEVLLNSILGETDSNISFGFPHRWVMNRAFGIVHRCIVFKNQLQVCIKLKSFERR